MQAQTAASDEETSGGATAQETDSVAVCSWFCVGDTVEYRMSSVAAEIVGNDTTVTETTRNEFMVCVTDSTKKGYELEYRLQDVFSSDTTSMRGIISLQKARLGIGQRVKVAISETGVIQRITNEKELYKKSLADMQQTVDRLYEQIPLLVGKISRQDMKKQLKEKLDTIFASHENLINQYYGLKLLFNNHGKIFPTGETEDDTDGYHITVSVTKGKLEDETDTTDDDYEIYYKLTEPEANGQQTNYYYDYTYFPDGWPRSVLVTIVEKQGEKTLLTQMAINWLSKAWK